MGVSLSRVGAAALSLMVLAATEPAAARSLVIEVLGCAALEGLDESLELELGSSEWRLVTAGDTSPDVRVEITVDDCDAPRWSAVFIPRDGLAAEPVALEVGDLSPRSRARVAALWIAEWLGVAPIESELAARSLARPEAASPAPADAPPIPGGTSRGLRIRATLVGTFRQYEATPATLAGGDLQVELARPDLVTLALELGLGAAGGSRWGSSLGSLEGHATALAATWLLPSLLEVALGVRVHLGHLVYYERAQHGGARITAPWYSGAGGLVRGTLFLERGLAIVVEVEAAYAIAPAVITLPARFEGDGVQLDHLLDGFQFAARAGLALE